MNQRRAQVLRGLAREYEAIGSDRNQGQGRRWAEELACEVLDGFSDYKLAAAFLTFCQGPLQHHFVLRYREDIQADGDRMVLRRYDDPITRREAAMAAVTTGRLIELDEAGTHWQFREPTSPLELVQWANREGIIGGQELDLPLQFLEGLAARVQAAAHHGAVKTEEEEPGGQYL